MPYLRDTLVSRRGYSGVGGMAKSYASSVRPIRDSYRTARSACCENCRCTGGEICPGCGNDRNSTRFVARGNVSQIGGLGSVLSDIGGAIKNVGGGALTFFGTQQQAVGAAAAAAQTNKDLAAALAAKQGPSTSTILIGGAAVAGLAYLLLRKKKAATP